ncbi:RNA methyltransferase [Echinicola jeungdonensis]|uniref:TrmH family RNA methyltransferase n=1 Tax=Echinicola jeungdonensis TaxID=709343 RepID=A0ABV5J5P3_9BACT|nr:RNA methyltransferase [Echinicola jeungdonensis]MDN3670999.1 RNA methyltransferase [Echinicola jeungdonensis]
MISKNTLKFIKSLQQKKIRKNERAFFVEGSKNVTELLKSDFEVTHLLFTDKYSLEQAALVDDFKGEKALVQAKVLESTGAFKSNDSALAVAKMKPNHPFSLDNDLAIALDDVRDPGNLGTIIRIADWYGIKKLILSEQTADFYNPKVLQASMGSFTRVDFFYTSLEKYLSQVNIPVYGAFLEGGNIYQAYLETPGIILMGNESKGISPNLEKWVNQKLTIPRLGNAESLNVAIATAIICDNFRRL